MCTVFSPVVKAIAIGIAEAMISIATPAIDSIVILMEYLNASAMASNLLIPYSAEHTDTSAPPMACAGTTPNATIFHAVV